MRSITLTVLLAILSQPSLSASGSSAGSAFPAELAGAWGSVQQCEHLLTGEPEHPGKATYRISADWIRQGLVHCQVNWLGEQTVPDGKRFHAMAQCGEDDLRDYRLLMQLSEEGLSIRWSLDYSTAVLQRCR